MGNAPDKLKIFRPAVKKTLLKPDGIFRRKETAEAFDQPADRFHVQLVSPAKAVYYFRPGIALLLVPDVVRKLYIAYFAAILVFARYCPYIHAYIISVYVYLCQELIAETCAYRFWAFPKSKSNKIKGLALRSARFLPTTVEPGFGEEPKMFVNLNYRVLVKQSLTGA